MQPPYSRTLFDLLDEQASSRPDGLAVICGEQTISYAALAGRARQAAGVLRAREIGRGDRVGLLINNRPEWLELAFGAWLLGAIVCPFSTWSTRQELDFLLSDSGVRVLVILARFAREDYAAILRDLVPEAFANPAGWHSARFPALRDILMLDGDHDAYIAARAAADPLPTLAPGEGASAVDPAIVLYTSGSTSRPKAIVLAHYLIIENGFNIGERQGLGPADRVLLSPPLFWAFGGINALPSAFTHGAALVLQGRFEAGEALELIERHRCTAIYTLPAMTDAMIRHPDFTPARTASLRTGLTIGTPQDVVRAALDLGAVEICNIYGSSETGGNCCVTDHAWELHRRANSQGMRLPGVEMRIVDHLTGEPVTPGEPGLAEVRGPYVMRGYSGASAVHNAASFSDGGWFRTGDIGQFLPDGAFVFLGRSTEMIKRAGINVSPAEVEEVLLQCLNVAQAGVVGVSSGGEEVIVAFIVPTDGATPTQAELRAHCRAMASSYKVPDHFVILTQLPTTVTGKLMRRDLKDAAQHLVDAAPALAEGS